LKTGIGGGLKQPTLIKAPVSVGNTTTAFNTSNGINQSGITSQKMNNRLSIKIEDQPTQQQ
jgi:hypothetical protein